MVPFGYTEDRHFGVAVVAMAPLGPRAAKVVFGAIFNGPSLPQWSPWRPKHVPDSSLPFRPLLATRACCSLRALSACMSCCHQWVIALWSWRVAIRGSLHACVVARGPGCAITVMAAVGNHVWDNLLRSGLPSIVPLMHLTLPCPHRPLHPLAH